MVGPNISIPGVVSRSQALPATPRLATLPSILDGLSPELVASTPRLMTTAISPPALLPPQVSPDMPASPLARIEPTTSAPAHWLTDSAVATTDTAAAAAAAAPEPQVSSSLVWALAAETGRSVQETQQQLDTSHARQMQALRQRHLEMQSNGWPGLRSVDLAGQYALGNTTDEQGPPPPFVTPIKRSNEGLPMQGLNTWEAVDPMEEEEVTFHHSADP
jgi:hypothetical protein